MRLGFSFWPILWVLISGGALCASLDEASSIYKKTVQQKDEGVYSIDGVLFVSSKLPITTKYPKKHILEGKSMLKAKSLLNSYLVETDSSPGKPSPESKILSSATLSFLEGHLPGEIQSRPEVSFSSKSRVIANRIEDKQYLYCLVFDAEALKKSLTIKYPNRNPSKATSLSFLQKGLTKFEGREKAHLRAELYSLIGSLELSLISANESSQTQLLSFWSPRSPLEFFDFSKLKDKSSKQGQTSESTFEPWSLLKLADKHLQNKDGLQSLNCLLLSRFLLSEDANWQRVREGCSSYLPKGVSSELTTLNRQFDASLNKGEISNYNIPIVAYSLRSQGRVNMPRHWSSRETVEYDEALGLFRRGQKLSKIKELCLESIQQSPRHGDSWSLLGQCLVVEKKHLEAISFFNQALRLNDEQDETTLIKLAQCYLELQHNALALGAALSASLVEDPSEWGEKTTATLLTTLLN